jgi:hypothetical protein
LAGSGGREEERRRLGVVMIAAAHDRAEQRKEGRKEGEGGLTDGAPVSATTEKEKRKGGHGPLREEPRWTGGPLGRKVRGEILFFFSFSFSNSFQIKSFKFKFKQNFSNFFTEFYKLFKLHTSNQNPCKDK